MKIKFRCHLLEMVIILCHSRAVIPDARNEYDEPFCLRVKTVFGHTRCSFLKRSAAIAPLLLYWTIWTADNHIEKCSIIAEPDLVENYLSLCREMRGWDLKETQSLSVNISQLMEPNGRCEFESNARRNLKWHMMDLQSDRIHRSVGKVRQKRAWILPGTFWCGHGSSAGDYEQLGVFEPVDRCCREHDHCSHIIRPFTLNFGVFNPTLFTVSHCDCDHRFKQCLLGINGTVSNMVGYTFFNFLKVRCFDLVKKKRCTKINWFGMCRSVQVAPFAVLKYSTPYNAVSSSHEGNIITHQAVHHTKASMNGKQINTKTKQRKPLESQGSYNQVTNLGEDTFWLSETLKERYDPSKTFLTGTTTPPSVWNTTTHLNSFTMHNPKLVHPKKQTIHQRTLSVQKSELCTTISPHVHITAAQGCHDQKPLPTPFPKSKSTNRRKMTTPQSHTTAKQTRMTKSSKPLRTKLNYFSTDPPRSNNLKLKQLRGRQCNTSKQKSLRASVSPKILTSSLAKIKGTKKSKRKKTKRRNLKQKIKVNHHLNVSTMAEIKNKLTIVSRNPSLAKFMPVSKLWRNTTSRPQMKTSLVQATSLPKTLATPGFKNSTKQEFISSVMKNTVVRKRCKSLKNSSVTNTASKATVSGYATQMQKSMSILRQKIMSAIETTETHNSSLWNITIFMSEDFKPTESPSVCEAARYLDDCKYRNRTMEKIYGFYNTESTTIYHCDCIHKLTSHLKLFRKAKILDLILVKFVSMSCIKLPHIKECNKHTSCPALVSKVTELLLANKEDQVPAKDEKRPTTKRVSDQLHKHCLEILNPRNPHVKNGPS